MHFGHPLPICSYFPQLSELLHLIPTSSTTGWSFYETLFARCIRETLSSMTGVQGRRMQRQLQPLIEIYGAMVSHKFRSKKKEASAYKEFVDSTLSGYATYVSSCINRLARQEREKEQQEKEQKKPDHPAAAKGIRSSGQGTQGQGLVVGKTEAGGNGGGGLFDSFRKGEHRG